MRIAVCAVLALATFVPAAAAAPITLPGTIANAPGSPISLTDCRASIVTTDAGETRLQPSAAYKNISPMAVAGLRISITTLDRQGADIDEVLYSGSSLDPGEKTTSEWIGPSDFPRDARGVRCAVRAVKFENNARWGTMPQSGELHRYIRPRSCGLPQGFTPATIRLRESGAAHVNPRNARLSLTSNVSLLPVLRALHVVPDKGNGIRLTTFEQLKPLFLDKPDRSGYVSITLPTLAPVTRYHVVVVVLDTKRSTDACPVIGEESIGSFRTGH